jgi:Flp pilus assembly protein TadD
MHAYQVALFLEPSNLDYRNNMAVLHLLRSDTTAAIRTFEEIVRVDSANVNAWINLGSLYALSGLVEQARASWTAALRHDPGNDMARGSLSRLAGEVGR